MATVLSVRPGVWHELHGLWFCVLPDPLTTTRVRVTIHVQGAHFWAHTDGPCGGVRLQTVPPDPDQQIA